jgi:hypothetical protein
MFLLKPFDQIQSMEPCGDKWQLFSITPTLALLLVACGSVWAAPSSASDNDLWEAQRLAALLIEQVDKDGDHVLSQEERHPIAGLPVLRVAKPDANGRITETSLVNAYQQRQSPVEGAARLNLGRGRSRCLCRSWSAASRSP